MDGLSNISGGIPTGYPSFTGSAAASPSSSRDQPEIPLGARMDVEAVTVQLFDRNEDQKVNERDAIAVYLQMTRGFQERFSKDAQRAKVIEEKEQTAREQHEAALARSRAVTETSAKAEAPTEGEKVEANAVSVRQPDQGKAARVDITV